MSETGSGPRAGRREWIGLAVLALPTLLVSVDVSVLFLALPHLSADLGASSIEQLWITDIYGFMTAGFLVTMGTLGDRIGRRKLLMVGGIAFGAASLLAAFSVNPEMLIIARALMGIAGATLLPSTMALISNMFRDPRQMGVAIAAWGTCFMAGIALGPIVGGALLDTFWWGSVFLLAAPVMVALLVAGSLFLPEYRDPNAGRLDLVSVALSLATILPVIWGLKEIAKQGWHPAPIAAMALGAAIGVVFVRRQRTLADPLMDLRLFGHRSLSAALLISLLVGGLQSGTALFVALHLQMVEGFSPLRAGLWLVPAALALVVGINAAPHVAARVRPAYVLATGMVISAVGQLLLTQVGSTDGLAVLVVGLSLAYFGVGPAAALLSHLVLDTAPPEKAGSASSLSGTGGEFGVALGIAALGSVGAAVYHSRVADSLPAGVPAESAQAARDSINGAVSAAAELPAPLGDALLDPAREAFTTALNTVAGIAAVLFLGLAVLAIALLRHVPPTGHGPHGEADESGPAEEADQGGPAAQTPPGGHASSVEQITPVVSDAR